MTCVHGNNPSTCSVCKTLAEIDALSGPPAGTGGGWRRGRGGPATGQERPARVDLITRTAERDRPARRSVGSHVALFVVVLVVAAASVWIVSGIVFEIIRLLEIIVVAGVAGTLGYRLGHYRGRHQG